MNVTNEQDETSLGYILQQARELRGLTQAQAANQLNLKVAVIAQMEAEQWDQSVAPTFMRGYLRSYARLLKLSETEILQAFAVQTAYLRHHPKEMKSFSNKTRRDAAESRFMLATYFVVVLLLGLFLVSVWQTHMLDDKPVSVLPEYNENVDLTVTEATGPSPLQNVTDSAQPETSAEAEINTAEPTAAAIEPSQNTAANVTAVQATSTNPVDNSPVSSPVTTEQGAVSTAEPEEMATQSPVALSTEGNINADAHTPATSTDNQDVARRGKLTMQFSKGCWVSVEDSSGKRLTYQMYQAGQEAQISGAYPLKVTLGEPSAVTLQLNDVSIDLTQYQTGRVARLTFNGPA